MSSIHQTKHAVIANKIQAAYYSLSLLLSNEKDHKVLYVGDLQKTVIKKVFQDSPQSFEVIRCKDLKEAEAKMSDGVKLVVVEQANILEDEIHIVTDEELVDVHNKCKSQGALLAVDISATFPLLLKQKSSL